jgi:hypothetical protein
MISASFPHSSRTKITTHGPLFDACSELGWFHFQKPPDAPESLILGD